MDNCILDGYPKLGLDNLTSAATKLIRGAAGLLTETQTMPLTSESAPVLAQVRGKEIMCAMTVSFLNMFVGGKR